MRKLPRFCAECFAEFCWLINLWVYLTWIPLRKLSVFPKKLLLWRSFKKNPELLPRRLDSLAEEAAKAAEEAAALKNQTTLFGCWLIYCAVVCCVVISLLLCLLCCLIVCLAVWLFCWSLFGCCVAVLMDCLIVWLFNGCVVVWLLIDYVIVVLLLIGCTVVLLFSCWIVCWIVWVLFAWLFPSAHTGSILVTVTLKLNRVMSVQWPQCKLFET